MKSSRDYLSLDKQMLQDVLRKRLKPAELRSQCEVIKVCYDVSERRA